MARASFLALLLSLSLSLCVAKPQTSGADILDAANSARQYGQNGGDIDQDLVREGGRQTREH